MIEDFDRQCIGSLLRGPETLRATLATGIDESVFASVAARDAFRAIIALDMESAPVTAENVAHAGSLDVSELREWELEGTPSAAPWYAKQAIDAAARRKIDEELVRARCQLQIRRPEDVLEELRAQSFTTVNAAETQMIGDFADTALDSIDPEKRATAVYSTGMPGLDAALGGGLNMDDEQVIIAAAPGCGKTTFMLQIAQAIAGRYGITPLVFSLEMSGRALASKLIGSRAGVAIRKPSYSADEWAALLGAREWLRSLPLSIVKGTATTKQIKSIVMRHIDKHGPTPIFVDYLQLMRGSATLREQVVDASRTLRDVGVDLGVPIVAAAQLNRGGKTSGKAPTMYDLAESGQIENDATNILLMWRPNPEELEVGLKFGKQRFSVDGRQPKLAYRWHKSGQRFEEVVGD